VAPSTAALLPKTKKEREMLGKYQSQLKKELAGIEEHIQKFRKN